VDAVRPIIKHGGTILHTSRTNAYDKKHPEYLPNLLRTWTGWSLMPSSPSAATIR
jgi:hypothetical protein